MRMSCDSNCSSCVMSGGRTRDLDDNFIAYFCSKCYKAFFCEVGVVRSASTTGGHSHRCPECDASLERLTLEEISIRKTKFSMEFLGYKRPSSLYSYLRENRITPQSILSLRNENTQVSLFHHTLILETIRISGLTSQIIVNYAIEYGLNEQAIKKASGSPKEVLNEIYKISPQFIEDIHSILINRDNSINGSMALRFMVYSSNIPDIFYIHPTRAISASGPQDLVAYNPQGRLIWIFCSPKILDLEDVEEIVNPILAQDKSRFKGVEKIFLVANGFSYVARKIIKRYEGIIINERKDKRRLIPFELWKEKPKHRSKEISFERVY